MTDSLRQQTVAEVGLRHPLRTPFERWPHGTDFVLAGLALTLTLSMWEARDTLDMNTFAGVGSWMLAFIASFALLWRRSHPFVVHALVLCACVISLWSPLADGNVALVFTLYSTGRYEADQNLSWLAVGAALLYLTFDLKLVTDPSVSDTIAAGLAIVLWYFGRRMRFRGEYLRLLEERAEHLQREQNAQAEQAVAAERTRIAREMHDVVAHQVSLMTVQAGAARTITNSDPAAASDAMAAVESAGRQALTEMRGLLNVLRPDDETDALSPQPSLDDLPNLIQQVTEVGLTVSFEQSGELASLSPRKQLSLYRITQEALTNVIKHAGDAASVDVSLIGHEEQIELRISDNGRGNSATATGGHGLIGMRERAEQLGGTLQTQANDMGFEVSVTVPRRKGNT